MKLFPDELKSRLMWFRRVQYALLGSSLVLFVAVYFMWIRPANVELAGAHAQIVSAENELEQNQDRAKNLPKVEREIDRLRQRVERFDKKLPRQPDLAQFINDVTRISQEAALKNLSWHLDAKPKQSEHFTELPILFSFEGDFRSGIVEFLRGTEDMQRLTRVRKFEIHTSDARDGQVKADVTMNIYFGED